ncbi:entericidin A/B family lipoprotein [Candidatus Sodalis pierantonius]|nr:entericidin A/B family lipoprotein [Candidatus Sodalis pierantonius]
MYTESGTGSALTTLSGCNTTRGFGEDVQHLGGAISQVAS